MVQGIGRRGFRTNIWNWYKVYLKNQSYQAYLNRLQIYPFPHTVIFLKRHGRGDPRLANADHYDQLRVKSTVGGLN